MGGSTRRVVAGAALALSLAVAPALAAGGGNDRSFGRHGVATFNFGFSHTPGTAIMGEAIEPDGGIVLAGAAGDMGGANDVLVTRLTPRGVIDRHFGHRGRVELNLGLPGEPWSFASAVALAPGGGIVIAVTGSNIPPAVVLLTRAGALDRHFGHGGVVRVPLPGHLSIQTTLSAIAVTRDGAIVVVGEGVTDVAPACAFVAELTPRGAPDRRLGGDGVVCPQLDSAAAARPYRPACWANGVRIDGRGRIDLVGVRTISDATGSWMRGVVARLTPSGRLDRSFGHGGTASMGAPDGEALAIDRLGRLIATGSEEIDHGYKSLGYALVVERFNSRGVPDRQFGRGGQATVRGAYDPTGRYESVALEPGGDVIVATPVSPVATNLTSLVALTAGGRLDRRFGRGGTRRFRLQINALATTPGGRIVASGAQPWGPELTLQRGVALRFLGP